MSHINLLPWRERKRQRERLQLTRYLLVGLSMALSMVFFMHHQASRLSELERQRHQQLQNEIMQSIQQIKAIHEMSVLRRSQLSRVAILQNLQEMRLNPLRLLDELITMMPNGVYLNRIECMGNKVLLLGYAESTASISELMRRIEANVGILAPSLTEIKTTSRENEFKLNFMLKSIFILSPTG